MKLSGCLSLKIGYYGYMNRRFSVNTEIAIKNNPKYKIIIFRCDNGEFGFQLIRDTFIDRIFNFGGYKYLDTKFVEKYDSIEDCCKMLLEKIWASLEKHKVITEIKSNKNQYLLAVVDSIKEYI